MQYTFMTGKVKLGKKGQITLPKKIRDEDKLKENDIFIITHTASGDIILRKKQLKTPEDVMIEAIESAPHFDWRDAWKEVEHERNRERS